jgi:hypothetical protein
MTVAIVISRISAGGNLCETSRRQIHAQDEIDQTAWRPGRRETAGRGQASPKTEVRDLASRASFDEIVNPAPKFAIRTASGHAISCKIKVLKRVLQSDWTLVMEVKFQA